MKKWTLALIAVAALVACQPEDEVVEHHGAAGTLAGSAFYFERIAMPEDASLEIVLLDTTGATERVLTRKVVDDVGNPPYTFEIDYDPAGIDPTEDHELWLTLYMPDGTARFAAEVNVDLSVMDMPQVRLIALEPEYERESDEEIEHEPEAEPEGEAEEEAESVDAPQLPTATDWQCGDVPVEVVFDGEQVLLTLPWTDAVLPQTGAVEGTRFAADGLEIWVRGEEDVTLGAPGLDRVACSVRDRASPWARARDEGVYFRAVGNEPGWVLELYDPAQPVLSLVLDGGTRELEFDTVIEDPDGDGYIAESPGNHAGIILIRESCRDTMVGWTFPYRVEMLLNDEELTACGRYL